MCPLQVCRKVRQKFPASALPVIMVSAKSQEGDIVEGLKAGANDYLTKASQRNKEDTWNLRSVILKDLESSGRGQAGARERVASKRVDIIGVSAFTFQAPRLLTQPQSD